MIKITNDNRAMRVKIKELYLGATFEYDNSYYIRTAEKSGELRTCVNLLTGQIAHLSEDLLVYSISFNCEVV